MMKYILSIFFLCISTVCISQESYYISPTGNDRNPGTIDSPFFSLEIALAIVGEMRSNNDTSFVNIILKGGIYKISETIELAAEISNIRISAFNNEQVIFSGGLNIPVKEIHKPSEAGLPSNELHADVLILDLHKLGIEDYGIIRNKGFARPYTPSHGEIFLNGIPMKLSRWPNHTMLPMGEVLDPGAIPRQGDYSKGGGKFTYDSLRISGWERPEEIWIGGYFMWGYADDAVKVASIDSGSRTITTAEPTLYGFGSGKPFRRWYAFNILEELDEPGEYYIDRDTGVVYFIPPVEPIISLQFSCLEDPFLQLDGCSNVIIDGIIFENARGMGLAMSKTENAVISNCKFRNLGSLGISVGLGIEPFADYRHEGEGLPQQGSPGSLQQHLYANTTFNRSGGYNNRILSCEFYQLGAGGVSLGGGDRLTLTPGGNTVENSVFHDINRLEKSYRPAVHITGAGNRIIHCEIYNTPSMAIQMHGNDHVIEYNNIHDVCQEVDDQGAIYYGRDPSERGTVIRYNYFHHIPDEYSTCAVYADDGACGLSVTDNVFNSAGKYAILLGGGSDNTISNNIFIEMKMGIHIDNRLENWSASVLDSGGIFSKRLEAVNYGSPPYINAYPELLEYWQNPSYPTNNLVENNVFFNVDKVIDGNEDWLVYRPDNWETKKDPQFADLENDNFFLYNKSEVYDSIPGFQEIPFHKMGIYESRSMRILRARNGLLKPVNDDSEDEWKMKEESINAYKVNDEKVWKIVERIISDKKDAAYPNENLDAQWFGDGNFGLFMHWGPPSINGSQPSWAMVKHYPHGYESKYSDPKKYFDLGNEFNPEQWDPDKICKAAKDAGISYVVLTAKHHDGFALWPSKYGNYNIGQGKDLLAPYVEACRANGLKVGFYFSQRDWHFPDYPIYDTNLNHRTRTKYPVFDPVLDSIRYYNWLAYTVGQINELLTNYGEIDVLWFDGFLWPDIEAKHYSHAVINWIRSLQPGIVVNDRWYKVRNPDSDNEMIGSGDFSTIEWKEPEGLINTWWEFCTSWCESWGYSKLRFDDREALRLLVKARSLGGNFLLNIGPSSEGLPPENFYTYTEQLSHWIIPNKEALFGKRIEGYNSVFSNVMMTKNDNTLFLHILPGEKSINIEFIVDCEIHNMHHLSEGRKIKYKRKNERYVISCKKNKLNTGDYHVIAVDTD